MISKVDTGSPIRSCSNKKVGCNDDPKKSHPAAEALPMPPLGERAKSMVAVAIFSTDPVLRLSLEQLLRGRSTITIVPVADDPAALPALIEQNQIDVVLADAPGRER